ncbi:WD repeat-containing protein 76 [Tanacetum coccineum]
MSQRTLQQPGDANTLYFGVGEGVVRRWDQRSRKSILSWDIHESVVNTIDFNPENTNIMATSSLDKTACIWDLRKLSKSKPECVKLIVRKSPVYSAYFSPSGSFLATTSVDDQIGVLSGKNYDEEFMINHNNHTGNYIPSFKGIWGWDDSYIFVGNKKKGVDVISAYTKTIVTTLESPHMSCLFDAHPFIPGMLAGATGGSQKIITSLALVQDQKHSSHLEATALPKDFNTLANPTRMFVLTSGATCGSLYATTIL